MPSTNFSPDSLPDLGGRVYIVTGGNTGIGKATVVGLAARGAKVYMGARSESKATKAIHEIQTKFPQAVVRSLILDLSDLKSVVAAASTIRSKETALHGLVNNAGVMATPFSTTMDGYEIQFQTNYLAHWLLTFHLLPLLHATAGSSARGMVRIVNVTSDGHALYAPKGGINFEDLSLKKDSSMTRYGQSKLANVLHTKQLNLKHGPASDHADLDPIIVAAVHPGHIDTNLNKQATGAAPGFLLKAIVPFMKCAGILDEQAKGAISSLFAVASDKFAVGDSGAYVVPYAKFGTPSTFAQDTVLGEKLWEWTWKELETKGLLN